MTTPLQCHTAFMHNVTGCRPQGMHTHLAQALRRTEQHRNDMMLACSAFGCMSGNFALYSADQGSWHHMHASLQSPA